MTTDKSFGERDENLAGLETDADIGLIVDYLTRELTPEQAAAVDQRLATDPAFYLKVAPVIKAWLMPVSFRQRPVRPASQVEKRRSGVIWQTIVEQGKRLKKAAGLIVVGIGSLTMLTTVVVLLTTPPKVTVHAFSTVDGTSLPVQYDKKFTPRTGDSTERVPRTVIRTVQHASAPAAPAGQQRLDRAPVIGIKNGTEVETGPDETMVFALGKRGRVVLAPNSRFTWTLTMALLPWSHRNVVAALDGEATIEPDSGTAVSLWTSAGKASMSRGASALRCEPGCEALLVTAKTGLVALLGTERGNTMTVRAGQWGRLPKGGKPAQDPEGKGFPVVEPRKP